jgi:hypothetical protein
MFSRVRIFFHRLKSTVDCIDVGLKQMSRNMERFAFQFTSLFAAQKISLDAIQKQNAEIIKRISSIEMELLLTRGACLDNSFPGKGEM